jgi:hypothetical protein
MSSVSRSRNLADVRRHQHGLQLERLGQRDERLDARDRLAALDPPDGRRGC